MSEPDIEKVKKLLEDASAIEDPARRRRLIDSACANDPQLRAEVDAHLSRSETIENVREAGAEQLSAIPPRDKPGHVGKYRLLEAIGEGGMGIVYKAQQTTPIHRIVALKVIKLGMDTQAVIARFESERQALALMNHPNVAQVYDAGTSDTGRPYFAMEYVRGEPITKFCDRQHFSTRQRLELFMQACDAVQHAHQKAIIHRDLKPSNILVMHQNQKHIVKVIDFGIAKATAGRLTERTLFTESGQLIGTPEYMSPEQAEMGILDVDTRSDIYSLGVVLYELITGALPIDPKTLRSAGYNQMQQIIRDHEPPRPSTRLSSLGDVAAEVARNRATHVEDLTRQLRSELEWIPLKAMRKDRAQRYSTADQLAGDIRNYLASRPLLAGPESTGYRLKKFVRRNKGAVLACCAVALALLLGMASTAWQAVRATRAERQAQTEMQTSQAVNQFLTQDLLASASPEIARKRDFTVREAVDRAAQNIAQRFQNQPLIEAAVRGTLATTYAAIGHADLAMPHARSAYEIRRRTLGENHLDTIGSLNDLGATCISAGKFAEAEGFLRDAVERSNRALGADSPLPYNCLGNLASALRQQGRYAEAEPLYRQSLEGMRRTTGPQSIETMRAINGLALFLHTQERFTEAEPLYREAIEIIIHAGGRDHPDYLNGLNNLAGLLQNEGKHAEAQKMFREVLDARRRLLGDDHPATLQSMNNLAVVLRLLKKPDEAEPLYREALTRRRSAMGEDHPDTLQSINNLAFFLFSQKQMTEAEALFGEAIEKRRKALGPQHPDTINSISNLAGLLEAQQRYAEAEPMLASLCVEENVRSVTPKLVANFVARYGICLAKLGKLPEAERTLLDGEQRLRQTQQDRTPRMLDTMMTLSSVYAQMNRPEEAKSWQAKADALRAATRPATKSTTRDAK